MRRTLPGRVLFVSVDLYAAFLAKEEQDGYNKDEVSTVDTEKLGRIIAAERKKMGWTQAQLADKLAVSDKAVSKWERGVSQS